MEQIAKNRTLNAVDVVPGLDLRQFDPLNVLWRGKWRILIVTVVTVIAGYYYVSNMVTPRYTAMAVVALDTRSAQVVDSGSVIAGISGDFYTVNTETEVIRSMRLIGALVDDMNLIEDPYFNPILAQKLAAEEAAMEETDQDGLLPAWLSEWLFGNEPPPPVMAENEIRDLVIMGVLGAISVENLDLSHVFNIMVETTDPEKSALIANRLAEVYIRNQLEVKFAATEQATVWLAERVATLKDELEAAESEVEAYKAEAELISVAVLERANRQLKDFRQRLEELEATRITQAARLTVLEEAAALDDPAAIAAAVAAPQIDAAVAAGGEPDVLEARVRTRLDQLITQARSLLARTTEQANAVATSISDYEESVDRQADDLVRLQQLQREAEASRAIYEHFLARLKEISVQQGSHQADSRILSDAAVIRAPSSPNMVMTVMLCLVLGVAIGTGHVLLRELRQNAKFRDGGDLESFTGYTLIGKVPQAQTGRGRSLLRYVSSKPSSVMAEAVRDLRTSIMLSSIDRSPQLIMLTSSLPGEGKTMLSLSLGASMAQMGKRTLVIEGDIRRRMFTRYLTTKHNRGLVSAVSGEASFEESVSHDPALGVDILFGERAKVNAADFFSSDSFAAFIHESRQRYEMIVLDTPPILIVPDARVLGQLADVIGYVVKWDSTHRAVVQQGLRAFETINLRVNGVILNQINPKGISRYGYVNQYGYGKKYYGR